MVVMNRHCYDHGEKVLAQCAHRKADRCDDDFGRAARIHASAERQRFSKGEAGEFSADKSAAELADAGDCDQSQVSNSKLYVLEDRKIRGKTGGAEEYWHEKGDDQPAQLLVDVTGEDR